MSNKRQVDIAWEQLFEKYDILGRVEENGTFLISASTIKEYREPRLMAKFDHTVNLPKIFSDNGLAILPITRGDYVISHFDAYHRFEIDSASITKASLPSYIQSLDVNNISSESIALNCAYASGIISDFMEDDDIVATVSGRKGSGRFSFVINDIKANVSRQLNVTNSQIEVDAAYEGISSLALFEAKRDLSEDFLIRQLYYPFRVWRNGVTKQVKSIYLVYSNGVYRLYEYMFDDPNNYNSLVLIKQKFYSVEDTIISLSDIQEVLSSVTLIEEPKIPFPQADKFERIINLCELLSTQELSRADVTEKYAFDERQTNYYTDAARYLGLLDKRKEGGIPVYTLTCKGKRILDLGFKRRQLAYCSCILSHKVFWDSLRLYLQKGVMPSVHEIAEIMKVSRLYQIESESTFERRSSTVKGWLNWIVSLINE